MTAHASTLFHHKPGATHCLFFYRWVNFLNKVCVLVGRRGNECRKVSDKNKTSIDKKMLSKLTVEGSSLHPYRKELTANSVFMLKD